MILFLALVAGSATAGYYATPRQTPERDQVGLIPDKLVHDLGRLGQSELVQVEFTLTNRYPAPVEIKDIHTSCSCQVPVVSRKHLAFGPWDRLAICVAIVPLLCLLSRTRADVPVEEVADYVPCPGQTGSDKCENWTKDGKAYCEGKQWKQVHADLFKCKSWPGSFCWCHPLFDDDGPEMRDCTSLSQCVWEGGCEKGDLVNDPLNPTTAAVYWTECAW